MKIELTVTDAIVRAAALAGVNAVLASHNLPPLAGPITYERDLMVARAQLNAALPFFRVQAAAALENSQ